jgi:hypothetical protein
VLPVDGVPGHHEELPLREGGAHIELPPAGTGTFVRPQPRRRPISAANRNLATTVSIMIKALHCVGELLVPRGQANE